MIHSLQLQNFKCFENQTIALRNLTLLSGLNGMGKSSVIQSLLLLRQSFQQGLLPHKGLALNGDLARVGTAKDALFENASDDYISFSLEWTDMGCTTWRFKYDQEVDVLALDSPPVSSNTYEASLFSDNCHYLQAERVGPRTAFDMSDYLVRQHRQLGSHGEYTAYFLYVYGKQAIAHKKLSHPRATSLDLQDQVEAWIGEVSPGTRIHLNSNSGMDLMSLEFSFVVENQVSNNYRATNVGFGITYTLPIIVAVLSAQTDSLVLIENPEAHLHPKGQAQMGALLACAASCGVQIVVETHSDHVLNGIRLATHRGELDPNCAQLHFFQRQHQQATEIISPRLDRAGRIDPWPDNFFDEWDKSLESLLEPIER